MEELRIDDPEDSPRDSMKYKYSLFTKTGTPLYTAPEMQEAIKYRYDKNFTKIL